MPRLKPPAPAIDQIEQDFLTALDRLQEGKPTNKTLKASKVKGILKITTSNVALEAGRSRTLIAMEHCRYPRVREMIKLAKGGKTAEPRTHTELIQRLRADIADLRAQVKQYQAEATAHFLARTKAEKEAAKERAAKSQLLKNIESSAKIVDLTSKK